MKRLIDGILYDTDTADKIADVSHRTGGFEDYDESLYKMSDPESIDWIYFLSGSGGPQSHYSTTENGTTTGDTKIIVLGCILTKKHPCSVNNDTKEKVLDWIGRHFVDDELVKVLKKSGIVSLHSFEGRK